MRSLSARLLLSLFVLLIVFFGITIAALDWVFRDFSERSLRELLDAQVLTLISASDIDANGGLTPPASLLDNRYATPGSGLYAEIRDSSGNIMWRSPSAVGTGVSFGPPAMRGERRYQSVQTPTRDDLVALSAGFRWEVDARSARDYVFSVAASLGPSREQLARFRTQLFLWFGGIAALLLVSLAVVLRQALSPLRRLARELRGVEAGELAELGSGYPTELTGATQAVNALLKSERLRLERYRNTLGNLAHSLKTPIAVMRSVLGERRGAGEPERVLAVQVERMDEIVQHQLRRAVASGGATLGQTAIAVQPVLAELRLALLRVYASKDLSIRVDCEAAVSFVGDRGDLLELLGNIAENACKYCRSTVSLTGELVTGDAQKLVVKIEDDGPGVPADLRARILERGVRADEASSGQGLGLSVARDIVAQYHGELRISDSKLGGALIELQLPGARAGA